MKIDYLGRVYDLDLDDVTNKQAVKILEFTGNESVTQWLATCADEKSAAFIPSVDALYWLMLRQNGDAETPIADVDYPLGRFLDAFRAALQAESEAQKAAEPEPDPTRLAADSAPSRALSSPKRKPGSVPGGGGGPDG